MLPFIAKTIGICLLLFFAAGINCLVREKILAPAFGSHGALHVSGFLLSAIISTVIYFNILFIGRTQSAEYIQDCWG